MLKLRHSLRSISKIKHELLRYDVLELPCQLQASTKAEARVAKQAPKPPQGAQGQKPTTQLLRARAQTRIQRRPEKREAEGKRETKEQEM